MSLQYGGGFATASSAKMHNNQTKSQEKNGRMMGNNERIWENHVKIIGEYGGIMVK